MSFNAFLKQNATLPENKKVIISKRFVGEDGEPIPFEIRPISEAENTKIKNRCMVKSTVKGRRTSEFDSVKYMKIIMAAAVVFPDLMDAELQNSYGVVGAEELLTAMLLPGEYTDLQEKVSELNGFNENPGEQIEEVKNF